MEFDADLRLKDFDPDFKIFHELMARKIRKVLLVLSPYDAFILEEGGSLTSKIVSEYRGLNLSHPPRLIRVSSGEEALIRLQETQFDLVITLPQIDDMDCFTLGAEIKKISPDLPVILLAQSLKDVNVDTSALAGSGIDKVFIWSVDPDFLMSLVKNVEDHLNVERDTGVAMVRVIILVEDSPHYRSTFLPLLYKEVVRQTQAILDESLNQEHRLLKMRARPKILVAENYEEAVELYDRFKPYVFGVISDVRFPRNGAMEDDAGIALLSKIRQEVPDLPLLLLSSEPANREGALKIPAVFVDKNSPTLTAEIQDFLLTHLGFGDFVFRLPDGTEIDRAQNLQAFEEKLQSIPDESLKYHARGNHFSNWIMARSEVALASMLHRNRLSRLSNPEGLRKEIITKVHTLRKCRQMGVVTPFNSSGFDPEVMDFVTIGRGSMGGKAMGLAFMAAQFRKYPDLYERFPEIAIRIPQTCVITNEGFDSFISHNRLGDVFLEEEDEAIAERFLAAEMPAWLEKELAGYLQKMKTPLTVRSSSPLEDVQYKPYAGLFETYMIPNNHDDFGVRLAHLLSAVKLVFASALFAGPREFSRATQTTRQGGMAVMIQGLVGRPYGDYFYPAISGVAQSYNYYPFGNMNPEEGTALIALGFGKTVVEGERCLRFSPRYPKVLPQLSTVEDTLEYTQRYFYALRIRGYPSALPFSRSSNLEKREIADADGEFPVQRLCSTYIPAEHRIRDSVGTGPKVLTFANILKYNIFPLPELLTELLALGRKGMGCPVEIEFAVDLYEEGRPGDFYFLQIRPMAAGGERLRITIEQEEIDRSFCYSGEGLGHGVNEEIADIVFVKPDDFDPSRTMEIAREIGRINGVLRKEGRPYLLIGPGRWGSADRWLGIPVQWQDISGVGAIIELRTEKLKADPSQGSHFFHNITSLGIPYITVTEGRDKLDWQWLKARAKVDETVNLLHVRLEKPFTLKVDGAKTRQAVIYAKT